MSSWHHNLKLKLIMVDKTNINKDITKNLLTKIE